MLGDGRFENWFRIGWLSPITDADTTIRSNEYVPRVYLKAEDSSSLYICFRTVKQRVEGVRVNVIEQRGRTVGSTPIASARAHMIASEAELSLWESYSASTTGM